MISQAGLVLVVLSVAVGRPRRSLSTDQGIGERQVARPDHQGRRVPEKLDVEELRRHVEAEIARSAAGARQGPASNRSNNRLR